MFQPFSPLSCLLTQQTPGGHQGNLCCRHLSSLPSRSVPELECLLAPGALGILCSFHHSHGCPLPLFKLPREGAPPSWTPTIPPTQMASSTPSPEIFLQSTPYPQGQRLLLSGPLAITAFSLLRPTLPLELGLSTPIYSRGWWAGFSGYFGFLPLPSPHLYHLGCWFLVSVLLFSSTFPILLTQLPRPAPDAAD